MRKTGKLQAKVITKPNYVLHIGISATHHVYRNLKILKQNVYFSFCIYEVRKYVCYFSGTDSKHTGHGYLTAAQQLWVKKRTSVGILVNCTLCYSYLPDVSVHYSKRSAGSTVAVSCWHTVRRTVMLYYI